MESTTIVPQGFIWLLLSFLGASCGSFASVLIFRIPRDISVVMPRSFCDTCHKKLQFWHNIPIFSWLALCGRCSYCRVFIGFRPLVLEIMFALMAVTLYAKYGFNPAYIEKFALFFILACLSYIDMDTFLLPLTLLGALILLGILSCLFYTIYPELYVPISPRLLSSFMVFVTYKTFSLTDRLVGAVVGFFVLMLINLASTFILRRTGRLTKEQWAMGFGDAFLLGGLGLFAGFSHLIMLIFLASFVGSIAGILYKLRMRDTPYDSDIADGALPFGPFLALAALYIYL